MKEVDEHGRVVIPKDWRKHKLKSKKVVMKLKPDNSIEITPYERLDLTKYFDRALVEVESPLIDWHSLRRELHDKRKGQRQRQ